MIIDPSAIMAILLDEPERPAFVGAILDSTDCRISAGSWIEFAAVLTRREDDRTEALYDLMREFEIGIEPVDIAQGQIGHAAYRRYGRGSGDPAQLNLGDCFFYALAKATSQPLLFKGDDFTHTDVVQAL